MVISSIQHRVRLVGDLKISINLSYQIHLTSQSWFLLLTLGLDSTTLQRVQ